MAPADKQSLGPDIDHAADDRVDRPLPFWTFAGRKSIGKAEENKISIGIEPEFANSLLCLFFTQAPQSAFRMRQAAWMRACAVRDDDDTSRPVP